MAPSPSPSTRRSEPCPENEDRERERSSLTPPPPRRGAPSPAPAPVPFWARGRRRSRRDVSADGGNDDLGAKDERAEEEAAARALLAAASFGLPPSSSSSAAAAAPRSSRRGKDRRSGGGGKVGWFGRGERRRASAAAPDPIRAEQSGAFSFGAQSGEGPDDSTTGAVEPDESRRILRNDDNSNNRGVAIKADGRRLASSSADGDGTLGIDEEAVHVDASGPMGPVSIKYHQGSKTNATDAIKEDKRARQVDHLSFTASVSTLTASSAPATSAPAWASESASSISPQGSSATGDNYDATANVKGNVLDLGNASGDSGDDAQDVNASFDSFVRDAQALVDSDEFQRLASSSHRLAVSAASTTFSFARGAARTAVRLAVLPVTAPMSAATSAASFALNLTTSAAGAALHLAGDAAKHASGLAMSLVPIAATSNDDNNSLSSSGEARDQQQRHHFFLLDPLGSLLPIVVGVLGKVRDEAGSCVLGALGWQSAGQSSSEGGGDFGGRIGEALVVESSDDDREDDDNDEEREGEWIECRGVASTDGGECAAEERTGQRSVAAGVVAEEERRGSGRDKSPPRKIRSFMRVCDLDLYPEKEASVSSSSPATVFSSASLSSPGSVSPLPFVELRPKAPRKVDGDCSTAPAAIPEDDITDRALDALVRRGMALASSSCHPLASLSLPSSYNRPSWKPDGPTSRILRRYSSSSPPPPSSSPSIVTDENNFLSSSVPQSKEVRRLLETETLVWSCSSPGSSSYNKESPLFRGRGIISGFSPLDLAELLLDSDRVGEYNKYALGRVDELVLRQGGRGVCGGRSEAGSSAAEGCNAEEAAASAVDIMTTKVVRSENRVPFGGKTVTLRNVMHARRLSDVGGVTRCDSDEGGGGGDGNGNEDVEGYIIVSRSVRVGSSHHHAHCQGEDEGGARYPQMEENENENEIVWGVNVLRPVPEEPGVCSPLDDGGGAAATDLTCVSQVESNLVPPFLQERVGGMGVSEFFRSVRALGEKKKKIMAAAGDAQG